MKTVVVAGAVLAASVQASNAQTAYRYEHGPSTMCGIHGADTGDFLKQVRAQGSLRQSPASSRFELFVSDDGVTQWIFTKSSERAYPAATCRQLEKDSQGYWVAIRKIRCEADRVSCDSLAEEFRVLDGKLRHSR